MIMQNIAILLIVMLIIAGCTQAQDRQVKDETAKEIKKIESEKIYEPAKEKELEENKTEIKTDNSTKNESKNADVEINQTVVKSEPIKPIEKRINGKLVGERLQEASDRLHTQGSGQHIRDDFPDIRLVYTDDAKETGFPQMILPFRYYYSEEADKTFNICNIDFTVFICDGKLERLISKEDIDSGRCEVTPVYTGDSRIGGSGVIDYRN